MNANLLKKQFFMHCFLWNLENWPWWRGREPLNNCHGNALHGICRENEMTFVENIKKELPADGPFGLPPDIVDCTTFLQVFSDQLQMPNFFERKQCSRKTTRLPFLLWTLRCSTYDSKWKSLKVSKNAKLRRLFFQKSPRYEHRSPLLILWPPNWRPRATSGNWLLLRETLFSKIS